MSRSLIAVAALAAALQLGAPAGARVHHPIMTRLGHGLSHGLHRLGRGLRDATHPHHRRHHSA